MSFYSYSCTTICSPFTSDFIIGLTPMKKYYLLLIVVLTTVGSFYAYYESKADTCGGRCTGSSYCTACKNCSGCKHCNSGGSCGVCASPEPEPAPVKKTKVVKASSTKVNSSRSTTAKSAKTKTVMGSSSASNIHTVKTASINVRKEPSAKAEIICVIHHKKSVRILKKVDATWVEIEAFCDNNRRVTGYVHRSLLN